MATAPPTITALPTPPSRDDPANFTSRADAFLGALPAFGTESNAAASNVYANASEAAAAAQAASDSANTAAASANFKGAWSTLSGALNIPASCFHAGKLWVLKQNIANVAGQVPGVSANWIRNYPIQRLPILGADAAAAVPALNGEELANASDLFLTTFSPSALTHVCATASVFLAAQPNTSNAFVNTSADGLSWVARNLTTSASWRPVAGNGILGAFYGTTIKYSADGATWSIAKTLPFTPHSGLDMVASDTGSGACFMADNAGKLWKGTKKAGVDELEWADMGAYTAPIGTPTHLFVLPSGAVVIRSAGDNTGNYRSSADGAAPWTSRYLPDIGPSQARTVIQDTDGSLLTYQTSALSAPVHRSADGVNWTDLGFARARTTTSLRKIGDTYVHGGPADGAFSLHDGKWVLRNLRFALSADRMAARIGNVFVAVEGYAVYTFDATSGSAATSLFETA